MGQHLDKRTKERLVSLRNSGLTYREISRRLAIPESTVFDIIKKYQATGTHTRAYGTGTISKLTNQEKKSIVSISAQNPTKSAKSILGEIVNKGIKEVSVQTIRNTLHNHGLFGRIAEVKPLLNEKTIRSRLEICNAWKFAPDSEWARVVWSDEAPFTLFTSNPNQRIWRPAGERHNLKYTVPMVKHGGGKIMVWGCFSYYGVGKLVKINGNMDKYQYIRILSNNLDPSFNMMNLANPVFQQDNDPKHTSNYAKEFFALCDFTVIPWPSYSPDLNPIENLWAYMKKQIIGFRAKNEEDLFKKLEEIWYSIPTEFCQKLVLTMHQRVNECAKAKGGPTRW